jgi:hypothetical protein
MVGLADGGIGAFRAYDRVTVEARDDEVVMPPDERHSHRLNHPTGYVSGECGLSGVLASDEEEAHVSCVVAFYCPFMLRQAQHERENI